MEIAGIQKSSMVDYPGEISIVVFTPHCNYDCFYCHNRSILKDPELLDTQKVLRFIEKRAGLIEALVVSGGEPTMQEDLVDFLKIAKSFNYKVKLDTNGSNLPVIKKLYKMKLIDFIAIDLKAPFEKYSNICGGKADGELAREAIEYVKRKKIPYEIRTTFIPQLTMGEMIDTLKEIAPIEKYSIQQYVKPQVIRGEHRFRAKVKPHSIGYLRQYELECKKYCEEVILKA